MGLKKISVIFILPALFSIVFGSIVMADILDKPGRELDMGLKPLKLPSLYTPSIEIVGLTGQYLTTEPIEVQVMIYDESFDCGDLYITIYESQTPIEQSSYLEQCFGQTSIVPIGEQFSKVIDTPGSYEITVEMVSPQLDTISATRTFTVK